MPGEQKPIFILGVGAQKAGTSWLHSMLDKQPQVDMGLRKEYHVWDAKFKPELFKSLIIDAKPDDEGEQSLRWKMQNEDGVYEEYFAGLIKDGVGVTGDISPSYNALDAEHFKDIRKRIEGKGFDLKVVFLMRDPARRVWSALRMLRRKRSDKKDIEFSDQKFFKIFRTRMRKEGNIARTRYDHTIEALREAFDPGQLYFGFYESMFDKAELTRLSQFLTVDLTGADTEKRVNPSPKTDMPDKLLVQCRKLHRDVYKYCFQEFPESRQLWSSTWDLKWKKPDPSGKHAKTPATKAPASGE